MEIKGGADLNRLYNKSNEQLERHFAEIRSNILLNAGFHYPNRNRFQNIRSLSNVDSSKKIRVTKNHTQRICKKIINALSEAGIDVGIYPRNDSELADQKSAELHSAVWSYIEDNQSFDQTKYQLINDFVVCGEAFLKVMFDPDKGEIIGYDVETDEMGMPLGEPQPVFSGAITFERIFPFNCLTDIEAQSFEESRYVIVKKLIPTVDLKDKYKDDDEKRRSITENDDTLQIFDGLTGTYSESKEHTQVNEVYVRPCAAYPTGYYYYHVHGSEVILEEGELYRFPILYMGFDEHPTSPRAYSIIKQIRPYQQEINRCASAVILESVTLGHSTVLTQAGTKLSTEGIGNGMKKLAYTGMKPEVISGRNGDQYIEYMNQQVTEMYLLADAEEFEKEKQSQANDAFSMLFRSIKQRRKFSLYGEKIERFLKSTCHLAIELSQAYLPDEMVIPMVGKDEVVNMAEFRNSEPLSRVIKIEPRSEDFETTMGKSLQINQLLQYAGSSLTQEQVGILARNMPFLNKEQMLSDLTLNYDTATNTILALDRGEQPVFTPEEDHPYMMSRLVARMKKADYPRLDPQIQQGYQQRLQMHQQAFHQQKLDAAEASAGFIPTGGGLTGVDMYRPNEDGKQKRVRIPFESVAWLLKRLEKQNSSQEDLDQMDMSQQAALGQIQQQGMNPGQNVVQMPGQAFGQ